MRTVRWTRRIPLVIALIAGGFALWATVRPVDRARRRAESLRFVQQARGEEEAGRPDSAERLLHQALRTDPDAVDALRALGALALRRNRAENAARWLARAETLEPGSYETIYNLGLAYRRLGRVEEAARYRDEAARIRKTLPPKPGGMGAPPSEMKRSKMP